MEGQKAVEFTLAGIDADGQERDFQLSDLLKEAKYLVLYFYPRDNTPGCTQEACDFRDSLNIILPYARVAGVSADSVESHKKFKEKHALNFPLLSDPQHKTMELYGAWGQKTSYGKTTTGTIRSTVIIAHDATIIKHYKAVKAKGHALRVVEDLKRISQ